MGFRDAALAGRLGGLARSARYDGQTVTHKARGAFADSFLFGHECSACPPIAIPAELSRDERERRAGVLRKLHYTRIASLPRGTRKAAPAEGTKAGTATRTEGHGNGTPIAD